MPSEESPTAPDQRLRHLQAHERVDAARCRGGQSAALRGAALFQRGGLAIPAGRIGQATPGRDPAHQGRLRGHGGQAAPRVGVRQRLPHAGRHRGARLSARRGSGRGAFAGARLPARGGQLGDAQCGLRPRLLGARGAGAWSKRWAASRWSSARRRAAPAIRPISWRAPSASARELGWQPRYDDLRAIVSSSLAWERKLQREPWS